MKFALIIMYLAILYCQKIQVDTDYTPLNPAYNSIKQIQQRYDHYKSVIYKNISIEYEKCKEAVQTLECRNIDQWQSVIEELKLENANSEEAEIPFLTERKKSKVDKFAKVLNQTQSETETYQSLIGNLSDHQQKIMDAFYLIEEMYKLPKQNSDFVQLASKEDENETETSDSEPSASQLLNSDIPDLAKEQLTMAKEEYDIADQSIQAQTASNLLRTFNTKMAETLMHVNQVYEARSNSLTVKKEQLQGDILKVRVMLQNEVDKQAKNNERITQLEGQIAGCENMPTDELKDCNPIRVNASKLLTEIEIIQIRSELLRKHIGTAVEENLEQADIEQHLSKVVDAKDEAAKQEIIDYYLKDPEVQEVSNKEPNELYPMHHLKENLEEQNEEEQNANTEEANSTEEKA